MAKLINSKGLSNSTLQANILAVYSVVGNHTANWYESAQETLLSDCIELSVDYRTICAVTAVTSPALRWDKNLLTMRQIVTDWKGDGVTGGYMAYAANVYKATRILSGVDPLQVLGGLKVKAFYHNLLFPTVNTGFVTIDRHAINIALNGVNANVAKSGDFTATQKAHGIITSAYVQVAQSVRLLPQQLQAATWSYCAAPNSF